MTIFEKVIVLAQWITYSVDLFRSTFRRTANGWGEGGKDRNGTIMNAIRHIEETDGLMKRLQQTHDAVRPFVTHDF